jgi:hypothetical protein
VVVVIASLTAVDVGLNLRLVQDAFPNGVALTAAGRGRVIACILIDRYLDDLKNLNSLAMCLCRSLFCGFHKTLNSKTAREKMDFIAHLYIIWLYYKLF